jgi:hypothetical protein
MYLDCPLRITWTISMPERIVAARVIELGNGNDNSRIFLSEMPPT